jgi:hypothetical protein
MEGHTKHILSFYYQLEVLVQPGEQPAINAHTLSSRMSSFSVREPEL